MVVTSGRSSCKTPATSADQVGSLYLSRIKLNQQLSMSLSKMSTTFHTTLLPGRLIQSVLLPLSSLTAVHLIFTVSCLCSHSSTQMNHTSGKYSTITAGAWHCSPALSDRLRSRTNGVAITVTYLLSIRFLPSFSKFPHPELCPLSLWISFVPLLDP